MHLDSSPFPLRHYFAPLPTEEALGDRDDWDPIETAPRGKHIWGWCMYWGFSWFHYETHFAAPDWYLCGTWCVYRAEPVIWRPKGAPK